MLFIDYFVKEKTSTQAIETKSENFLINSEKQGIFYVNTSGFFMKWADEEEWNFALTWNKPIHFVKESKKFDVLHPITIIPQTHITRTSYIDMSGNGSGQQGDYNYSGKYHYFLIKGNWFKIEIHSTNGEFDFDEITMRFTNTKPHHVYCFVGRQQYNIDFNYFWINTQINMYQEFPEIKLERMNDNEVDLFLTLLFKL